MERGKPDRFEIIWDNGHTEVIEAHQVGYPDNFRSIMDGTPPDFDPAIEFHSEVNGRWGLVLRVKSNSISSIRNLTRTELSDAL